MSKLKIPDGFNIVTLPPLRRGWAIVKSKHANIIEKEIIPFIDKPKTFLTKGRAGLFRFVVNHPEIKHILVRPYKRGGMVGPLLKNIYWGKQRAIKELTITNLAFNKGLPVPEVLGVILQPKGLGFYQAFIMIREISDTSDLPDYLARLKTTDTRELFRQKQALFQAIIESLVQFHNAGFYHSDLNLRNLLVQKENHGTLKVWIVDLDRAKYYPDTPIKSGSGLTLNQRINNLIRLARSLVKLGLGKLIGPADRLLFLKCYLRAIGEDQKSLLRRINYYCAANIRRHRLWWKITKP